MRKPVGLVRRVASGAAGEGFGLLVIQHGVLLLAGQVWCAWRQAQTLRFGLPAICWISAGFLPIADCREDL